MKDSFENAVHPAIDATWERCLLLSPLTDRDSEPGDELPFRVRVVDLSLNRGLLTNAVKFLNTGFPVTEWSDRKRVAAAMAEAMEAAAIDLERHIDEVERQLAEEADARLSGLLAQWDQITPQIERAAELVRHQEAHFEVVGAMVRSYSARWRDFAERFFALSNSMVEGKLAAMTKLSEEHDRWRTVMGRLLQSLQHVSASCGVARDDMAPRIDAHEAERRVASEELERTETHFRDCAKGIRERQERIRAWIEDGRRMAEEVTTQANDARANAATLESSAARVEQAKERLEEYRDRFSQLISELQNNGKTSAQTVSRIDSQMNEMSKLDILWQTTLREGRSRGRAVAGTCQQAEQTLEKAVAQLGTIMNESKGQIKLLAEDLTKVRERQSQAKEDIERLKLALERVRHENNVLQGLRKQADELEQTLETAREERRLVDDRLKDLAKSFWYRRQQAAVGLQAEINELMSDLKILSDMEGSLRSAAEVRAAIRFQARLARTFQACRELTTEEYRRIWKVE